MGIFKAVSTNDVEGAALQEDDLLDLVEKQGDFTVDGVAYDIQYNQKQLRLYEGSHPPIMATFAMYHGMLSIGDLTAILAYGLREHGKNFVAPKRAMKMASALIDANGYAPVMEVVVTALERDCGFLFVGAED